jgi:hypothetical protein
MSLRVLVTLTLSLVACSKGPTPATTSAPSTSVTTSAPVATSVATSATNASADAAAPGDAAPAAPYDTAPEPAEVAPAEATAAPTAAPCVAKEEATGLERLTLTGAVVGFCIPDPNGGELALSCFDFDLATDTLTKKAPPAAPKPEAAGAPNDNTLSSGPHWKLDRTANKLDACPLPDACKALDLDGKVLHEDMTASESADGKYLVTILDTKSESAPVAPWVYVYELATGKRVAKKKVGDDSYTCGTASFVGNTVLVALDVCAGPGGIAWLAKPTSLAKIADLGPKDYNQFDPQFVALGGDEFAFLEAGARTVMVTYGVPGKVVRRLDLSSHFPTPEGYEAPDIPPYGGTIDLLDPAVAGAVGNGRILVTLSDGGFGKLLVIDATAERVVKVHELPRCPTHP